MTSEISSGVPFYSDWPACPFLYFFWDFILHLFIFLGIPPWIGIHKEYIQGSNQDILLKFYLLLRFTKMLLPKSLQKFFRFFRIFYGNSYKIIFYNLYRNYSWYCSRSFFRISKKNISEISLKVFLWFYQEFLLGFLKELLLVFFFSGNLSSTHPLNLHFENLEILLDSIFIRLWNCWSSLKYSDSFLSILKEFLEEPVNWIYGSQAKLVP